MEKKERQRQAWELRKQGWSVVEIAEKLGYVHSVISTDLKQAYLEYRLQHEKEAAEMGRLDLARLDTILRRLWPLIDRDEPDKQAVREAVRILERRARMLGIDQPNKEIVQVIENKTPDEMRQELQNMLEGK